MDNNPPTLQPYKSKRITNKGGVNARRGLSYQDHIAASYCLVMLTDSNLLEVASETEDDIVLGWKTETDDVLYEFVQVKNVDIGQAWTINHLVTSEIFQKSFQNDAWKETSCFRIVTSWSTDESLSLLKYPKSSPARLPSEKKFQELISALSQKCAEKKLDLTTPKGNDIKFWVQNCEWQVFHQKSDIENANLQTLDKFCDQISIFLTSKQRRELYSKLLEKIQATAEHDPDISIDEKCLRKDTICTFIRQEALRLSNVDGALMPYAPEKQEHKITEILKAQLALIQPSIAPALDTEHKAELDHAEELMKKRRPREALDYLGQIEKRLRTDSDNSVRYRLFSLKANAYYICRENQLAADCFLKAYSFNKMSDKAASNRAFALLLLDQKQDALSAIEEVIASNPALVDAYAILLLCIDSGQPMADLEKLVPHALIDGLEVKYTLAHLAANRGEHETAINYLTALRDKDKDEHLDLTSALATELVRSVDTERIKLASGQFSIEHVKRLEIAGELFDILIERIEKSDYSDARYEWYFNRASVRRLLGDKEGAAIDLDKALKLNSNPRMLFHRALLEFECDKIKETIATLESLLETEEGNEARHFLAMVLREHGSTRKAVTYLEDLLDRSPDDRFALLALQTLFSIKLEARELDDALEVVKTIREKFTLSLVPYMCEAEYFRKIGHKDTAEKCLKAASNIAEASKDLEELFFYAQALFQAQLFEDVIPVLLRFVQQDSNTNANRQLLWSYHKCGLVDKALEICVAVRRRYGIVEWFTKLEISWLLDVEDFDNALPLAKEYLDRFPSEHEMRVALASRYLKIGKKEDALNLIPKTYKLDAMPLSCWLVIAQILERSGNITQAIKLIYEIRRYFYKEESAHLGYLSLLNRNEEAEITLQEVTKHCAVQLQRNDGQLEWWIIDDRSDDDYRSSEFSSNHPLVSRLLNKKTGEKVRIRENEYGSDEVVIVKVISKYARAYQQTMERFEEWFPNCKAILRIENALQLDADGVPRAFKLMEKSAWQRHQLGTKAVDMYTHKLFTIGALARALGDRDPIEAWFALTENPKLGIHSCFEFNDTIAKATTPLLNDCECIVLDITALLTIHSIGAAETLLTLSKKLGITRSTIDAVMRGLEDKRQFKKRGAGTLGIFDGKLRMFVPDPASLDAPIKLLEEICAWVEKNCVILTLEPSLRIRADRTEMLTNLLGECFADSIFASLRPKHILYTDDALLRALALNEFKVRGLWTQGVLWAAKELSALDRKSYRSYVIKLAHLNYKYTSVDKDVLLQAAEWDGWSAGRNFDVTSRYLAGETSSESCVQLLAALFFDLYRVLKDKPIARQNIIIHAINYSTIDRSYLQLKKKLRTAIELRFGSIHSQQKDDLIATLEAWEKTRSITW